MVKSLLKRWKCEVQNFNQNHRNNEYRNPFLFKSSKFWAKPLIQNFWFRSQQISLNKLPSPSQNVEWRRFYPLQNSSKVFTTNPAKRFPQSAFSRDFPAVCFSLLFKRMKVFEEQKSSTFVWPPEYAHKMHLMNRNRWICTADAFYSKSWRKPNFESKVLKRMLLLEVTSRHHFIR